MSALGWHEVGDVVDGFCRACRSWFCPHAAPGLYGKRAPLRVVGNKFEGASNTLVLAGSHEQGISRGALGQAFAAEALGVELLSSERAPYDFRAADGTRVDVKTTRHGLPLMIPQRHAYKVDPERVDAFLLVWDGDGMKLVGQIGVREFAQRHRTDGAFPIPTMHVEVGDLEPVPESWHG